MCKKFLQSKLQIQFEESETFFHTKFIPIPIYNSSLSGPLDSHPLLDSYRISLYIPCPTFFAACTRGTLKGVSEAVCIKKSPKKS